MKVALTQHFLAHYRYSIFHQLSLSKGNEFVIYSDIKGLDGVRVIDSQLSNIDPGLGGISWKFVRNIFLGSHFLWQTRIIRLALSREYDAIIFLGNMYHLSTWVGAIISKMTGKSVFMWTHGFLYNERGVKGCLRFLFYNLADGLFLYGHRAKDILKNKGFPSHKLEVVYNSLDYNKQKSIRDSLLPINIAKLKKRLFVHDHLPVLIFIGRLTSQKKLDQLLAAAKILHQKFYPVNILVIGTGSEMNNLISMANDLDLQDYTHFYGETYEEIEIGNLISMSNVCVSPGEVGLTCMHVMAYGVPVITHNDFDHQMPEFEAIQPGLTGDFFDKDDVCSLSSCIYNFLNSKINQDLIKNKCIEVIESKYNSPVQFEIINSFINRCCSKS